MARIVLLIGPTGAGKSELAGRLVAAHGFTHISSGRILREHLANHPQMLAGELVTSSEVEDIIDATMTQVLENSRATAGAGILLDGFPRRLDQAQWLEGRLEPWSSSIWRAIHLDIDLATSQRRLSGRGRSDDSLESVSRKWHEYDLSTRPVIKWYEDHDQLSHVDASGSPEDVYNLVRQELSL